MTVTVHAIDLQIGTVGAIAIGELTALPRQFTLNGADLQAFFESP
jgi:hypothetical protein